MPGLSRPFRPRKHAQSTPSSPGDSTAALSPSPFEPPRSYTAPWCSCLDASRCVNPPSIPFSRLACALVPQRSADAQAPRRPTAQPPFRPAVAPAQCPVSPPTRLMRKFLGELISPSTPIRLPDSPQFRPQHAFVDYYRRPIHRSPMPPLCARVLSGKRPLYARPGRGRPLAYDIAHRAQGYRLVQLRAR